MGCELVGSDISGEVLVYRDFPSISLPVSAITQKPPMTVPTVG